MSEEEIIQDEEVFVEEPVEFAQTESAVEETPEERPADDDTLSQELREALEVSKALYGRCKK